MGLENPFGASSRVEKHEDEDTLSSIESVLEELERRTQGIDIGIASEETLIEEDINLNTDTASLRETISEVRDK